MGADPGPFTDLHLPADDGIWADLHILGQFGAGVNNCCCMYHIVAPDEQRQGGCSRQRKYIFLSPVPSPQSPIYCLSMSANVAFSSASAASLPSTYALPLKHQMPRLQAVAVISILSWSPGRTGRRNLALSIPAK